MLAEIASTADGRAERERTNWQKEADMIRGGTRRA